jgi:hypothetical protein
LTAWVFGCSLGATGIRGKAAGIKPSPPLLGLTVEYGDNVTGEGAPHAGGSAGDTGTRTPRLARILALPPASAARRLRFALNVGGRFS